MVQRTSPIDFPKSRGSPGTPRGDPGVASPKAFFAKLKYSPFLYDGTDDVEVGYLKDETSETRRSGVGAWSKRVHSKIVDIPFQEFADDGEKNKKFHRVKYFKKGNLFIWESQSFKKHGSYGSSPASNYSCSPPGSFGGSSSFSQHFQTHLSLGGAAADEHGSYHSPTTGGRGSPLGSTSWLGMHAAAGARSGGESSPPRLRAAEDLLPTEAWLLILQELRVRDLCVVCAVSKHLRDLVKGNFQLWHQLYKKTFGMPAEREWSSKVVKHVLCKSERLACKWLDAAEGHKPRGFKPVGFPDTQAMDLNESHCISGDRQNLRVWVHATDRRIKTLKGHSSNISCVGFSRSSQHDAIISSGDVTGHLKLWSMDELRNLRSLRAHADTVSDTLHFSSLCITCSLDGFIKVWDASQAHPLVLTLEGRSRIYNMSMHESCNRLYSVGNDIRGWDLETAQACVEIQEDDTMLGVDPEDYYGYHVDVWPGTGHRSKCLANNGSLLASAGKGIVNLYDLRSSRKCCSWRVAEEVLRSPAGGSVACTGLEIDEWKLLCGFKGAGSGVGLYDIRAASSGSMKAKTVMDLSPGEGRTILTFKVEGERVLAGMEGDLCHLWNFAAEEKAESDSDKEGDGKQSRQSKKKNKRCPKHRKKYPKRTTR